MKSEIVKNVDQNTGESVSKCEVPQDFKNEMAKVLDEHNKKLNNFMMISQQVSDLQIKWMDLRKEINKTDEKFKNKMKYIAKKLKLSESEPWTWNMQDHCFEMRQPPPIQPMTAGELPSVSISNKQGVSYNHPEHPANQETPGGT